MNANPADTTFTRRLAGALQRHVAALTPGRHTDGTHAEPAVAWVYTSLLAAWAEDHGLIAPWLRKPAAKQQQEYLAGSSDGARGWLTRAMHALISAHPSAWALADPRYTRMRELAPPQDACRDLLAWWADEAPDLAYEVETGPDSLSGWIPGDLLQAVGDLRRAGNALVQTPWWVADLILDQTLRPAAAEFPGETLRVIDPACGTGHFLVRAVDRLWELYTTGRMTPYRVGGAEPERIPGWAPVGPAEAARRILAGLHGIELDPMTAVVARLRVTVAVASKLAGGRPGCLARIPRWIRPGVVVGDSLLLGVVPEGEYRQVHPGLHDIYASEVGLFGAVAWPGDDRAAPVVPPAVVVPSSAEQLSLFGEVTA